MVYVMRKIEKQSTQNIQLREYEVFNWLKLPLAVLVVFVHTHISGTTIGGVSYLYDYENYPIFDNISFLVSNIVAALAVPTFFAISGYLFFKGLGNELGRFSVNNYVQKLKRRSRSLLVPYLLWNCIYLIIFFTGQSFLPGLLSGNHLLIKDYSLLDYLNSFWTGFNGYPICPPLWFVRDLMVMMILSPVLYILFEYIKFFPIIVFILLWIVLGYNNPFDVWSFKSAFFFYGGGYFAYCNRTIIDKLIPKKLFYIICYLITVVATMLCYNDCFIEIDSYTCKASLVLGVPVVLCAGYYAVQNNQIMKHGYSIKGIDFFIFGFHVIPLNFIIKIFLKIMVPQSEFTLIFVYFISPLITIIVGLILFVCLKKIFPRFTSMLTGGRL